MQRFTLVVASLLLLTGCNQRSIESCDLPANQGKPPCPPDSGMPEMKCKGNSDCTADPDLGVCDTNENGGTCVRCTATEHDACPLSARRCENHACVACVSDGDCDDRGVCLSGGACAAPSSIIHVKVTGSDTAGCGAIGNECTLPRALSEIRAQRNVIRLDDAGPYSASAMAFVVTSNMDTPVTIDARNATITRNDEGPIVTVSGMGQPVTILGGTIRGAIGTTGDGIVCSSNATLILEQTVIEMNGDSAIQSTDCRLTLTNAQIRGSTSVGVDVKNGTITASRSIFVANKRGGIKISDAKFVLVGNAIFDNGDIDNNSSPSVDIGTPFDADNRLDFNTIAFNMAQPSISGVVCVAGTSPTNIRLVGRNNIIWGNTDSQIAGNCQYSHSDIDQQVNGTSHSAGDNNLRVNPMLIRERAFPHLMAGSPVLQKADPSAILTGLAEKDIDGDKRFAPADLGADQVSKQ